MNKKVQQLGGKARWKGISKKKRSEMMRKVAMIAVEQRRVEREAYQRNSPFIY